MRIELIMLLLLLPVASAYKINNTEIIYSNVTGFDQEYFNAVIKKLSVSEFDGIKLINITEYPRTDCRVQDAAGFYDAAKRQITIMKANSMMKSYGFMFVLLHEIGHHKYYELPYSTRVEMWFELWQRQPQNINYLEEYYANDYAIRKIEWYGGSRDIPNPPYEYPAPESKTFWQSLWSWIMSLFG